ncbi:MAG TPA: VOC family protein [Burkholderiaceae bacterium]|nr:VOC family protein [Burkholderiaceae bacterium]
MGNTSWRALWLVCALSACGSAAGQAAWPPVGEPTQAARTPGRWLWVDLVTADAAKSRDFYGALFGWDIRNVAGDAGKPAYLTITANGQRIGGIVQSRNATAGARWIGLASGDPRVVAERAVQHGGKVIVAPRTLAGRGEFALIADPAGAHFGVVLAERGDPADRLGGRNEWLWTELWAPDPAAAADFYRAVLGYSTAPARSSAADAYVLSAGGRARAGVMRSPDPALPEVWIPYVRVDDVTAVVARAQGLGARVLVPTRAHHRSQFAVLADPQGAPFAVADWRPQP